MAKLTWKKLLLLALAIGLAGLVFYSKNMLEGAKLQPAAFVAKNIAPYVRGLSDNQPPAIEEIVTPPPQFSDPEMISQTGEATSSPATSTPAIRWGAYAGDKISDVSSFEKKVGRPMDIVAIFLSWADKGTVISQYTKSVRDQGKTLLIFWEPTKEVTYNSILAGLQNEYIEQFAAAAKNYEGEIILVPFHEMNGDWNTWGGTIGENNPTNFISAWRRLRNKFGEATNVKFGWAPNHVAVPDTPDNQLEKYYPGDQHVDIVGVDGFNFNEPWLSFDELFSEALKKLAKYKKPIYIFSFACAEGEQKAAWIEAALQKEYLTKKRISGWIWFNQDKENDWRVWSDENSLTVFKNNLP